VNQIEAGWQKVPDVVWLPSGRFAVVWQDVGTIDHKGRVVLLDGTMPLPEKALTGVPGDANGDPRVAAAPGGGGIVAWHTVLGGNRREPRVRLFDDTMDPLGAYVALSAGDGLNPVPAATSSGYIVTWSATDSGDTDVLARVLDSDAIPVAPEFQVNVYDDGNPQNPNDIAFDTRDLGVITWDSAWQDGDNTGVFARRIDAAGNLFGPEFQVNGNTNDSQGRGRIAMLPDGDFMIGWSSYQDTNGTESAYVRRYFFPHSLVLAPGPDATNAATVHVTSPDGLETAAAISPYGSAAHGANVGAGDIDGGLDEILTGPGPSPVYGPHIRAFRPDGTPVVSVSFFAYGTPRFGARPAGGDIEGDGFSEILTAPGQGSVFGPHIRAFDHDGGPLAAIPAVSFFAYQTPRWGARVAGGDIDGDTIQELVTGPGPGAIFGPHVRAFDYDGVQVQGLGQVSFNAFPSGSYGVTVGAADVESDGYGIYGDGFQEILVGRGPDPGVGSDVRLFDYDGAAVAFKFEITPYMSVYGASVAGGDIDAGDTEEVVTAPGPDPAAAADIIVWEWDPQTGNGNAARLQVLGPDQFTGFGGQTSHGGSVAVGTFE
jgi:hypothetical protein